MMLDNLTREGFIAPGMTKIEVIRALDYHAEAEGWPWNLIKESKIT